MRLRLRLLPILLAMSAATAQPAGIADRADVPASASQRHPERSMQAFGGVLIGTDRGEWIGSLQFQDAAGGKHTILEENVLGLVKNGEGVFVFTGLDHLSLNEGLVYVVKPDITNIPRAELLVRLSGTPGQVHQEPDGTTRFVVFTGHRDQQGRFLHECYQLVGHVVSRGTDCRPLQSAEPGDRAD